MSTESGGAPGHEPPDGEAIRRLLQLAGPRPAVSADRAARVHAAVHARWRASTRRETRLRAFFWGGLSLAAAALAVVVSFLIWRPGPLPPYGARTVATLLRVEGAAHRGDGEVLQAGDALPAGAEVATGADGRLAMEVDPGISMRLDRGSHAALVSDHVVELFGGAIYVDSGAGASVNRSLEVRTPMGIVRDVGTQFELRLDGPAMRLSVREGRAILDRQDRSYEAGPGTRVTVDASGAVRTGRLEPHGPEWDWVLEVAPPFRIEGRRLQEYLQWVSRETGLEVRFADAALVREAATTVLHGSVEGLTPDQTTAAVLPTCGLTHRLEGNVLIIERLEGRD